MAMTLRLDDARDTALTQLADQDHRPKSEIVTIAIDEYMARRDRQARLEAASAYILERDAELFARLASA